MEKADCNVEQKLFTKNPLLRIGIALLDTLRILSMNECMGCKNSHDIEVSFQGAFDRDPENHAALHEGQTAYNTNKVIREYIALLKATGLPIELVPPISTVKKRTN